jgi:membrane associated rhomboid family serine protease
MSSNPSDKLSSSRLAKRREAFEGLVLLTAIVALMWFLEVINSIDHDGLDHAAGIVPRDPGHVWAIFTAPFLHVSWTHLIDNTIPFVFMGVIIALWGAYRLALVTLIVIIVGGLGTWLVSPGGASTVGASGIVFGYATYLFARGVFNRSVLEILIGIVVAVVWGGALIASVQPHQGVSWQGHVSGAIGGLVAAWLLARPRTRAGSGTGPGSATDRDPMSRALAS